VWFEAASSSKVHLLWSHFSVKNADLVEDSCPLLHGFEASNFWQVRIAGNGLFPGLPHPFARDAQEAQSGTMSQS